VSPSAAYSHVNYTAMMEMEQWLGWQSTDGSIIRNRPLQRRGFDFQLAPLTDAQGLLRLHCKWTALLRRA